MKHLRLVSIFAVLGLGGLWVYHGMHMATLTQKQVKTEIVDDFGDKETVTKWEPTFEIGLDYVAPAVLVFTGLIGFTTWRLRRT